MCQNVCIGGFCVLEDREVFMKKVEMEEDLEILVGLIQRSGGICGNRIQLDSGVNEYG